MRLAVAAKEEDWVSNESPQSIPSRTLSRVLDKDHEDCTQHDQWPPIRALQFRNGATSVRVRDDNDEGEELGSRNGK